MKTPVIIAISVLVALILIYAIYAINERKKLEAEEKRRELEAIGGLAGGGTTSAGDVVDYIVSIFGKKKEQQTQTQA